MAATSIQLHRWWLLGGLTLTIAALGCGPSSVLGSRDQPDAEAKDRDRPNVVLLVLDTVRRDHLSLYGYERPTTPQLDRFAEQCVVYEDARSVAPWTLPAHASMFTGLLPGEHGVTWSRYDEDSDRTMPELLKEPSSLPQPEMLLARRLQAAGYNTIGLSANPWICRHNGFAEGFDTFYETFKAHGLPEGFRAGEDPMYSGDAGRVLAQLIVHEQQHSLPQPFFLFINIADPHFIYLPPPEYLSRFGGSGPMLGDLFAGVGLRDMELALLGGALAVSTEHLARFYDAELVYVDQVVGELLTRLREWGCFDDTLILVTSDHGELLGERGRYSHQLSLADELTRVPLLVKFPEGHGAGSHDSTSLVSNLDVYRTITAAAGLTTAVRSSVCPPQDLADMTRFERPLLLSESYYANAYLRQVANVSEGFDPAEYRVIRRTVHVPGQSFPWDGGEGAERGGTASPVVERIVATYATMADRGIVVDESAGDADPEVVESLRDLGYVAAE